MHGPDSIRMEPRSYGQTARSEATMTQQMAGFGAAQEYWADAWQRGVLFLDTLRERGNIYHEHVSQEIPHVLSFPVELVRDGRALERPVNYGAYAHCSADRRHGRSRQAADHRRRPPRRPWTRDRRHETGQRDRGRARRRPPLLLHRLFAKANAGPDDRGRLPRRSGLRRGGRRSGIPRPKASRSSSPIARQAGRS